MFEWFIKSATPVSTGAGGVGGVGSGVGGKAVGQALLTVSYKVFK